MKKLFYLFSAVILCFSCTGKTNTDAKAVLSKDEVKVAIDETFAPIMEEELGSFSLLHPDADTLPIYCSEDRAVRMFLSDSVHMAIITRKISKEEEQYLRSRSYKLMQAPIASDAFALIVNSQNNDTLIALEEVKGIVNGSIKQWNQLANSKRSGDIKLVFDKSGSSTVRYMKDSLNNGKDLGPNAFAQGSAEKVIEAVNHDPNVIGVVGVDWLKERGDSTLANFNGLGFNVMKVSALPLASAQYKHPYQYYIATGAYPLVRRVYAVCKDPLVKSKLKLFYHFLKGERGQLIICKNSQLLPNSPVFVKSVAIKN